jgi:hypothetical protein
VDLSKSDYDLIVKLLGSGGGGDETDGGVAKERPQPERGFEAELAEMLRAPKQMEARRRSSLDHPYGELMQKRQNALALNVFFTQGNWVFRENPRREDAAVNETNGNATPEQPGKNSSLPQPHCYELEFVKLHIFQLMQHAGTVRTHSVHP